MVTKKSNPRPLLPSTRCPAPGTSHAATNANVRRAIGKRLGSSKGMVRSGKWVGMSSVSVSLGCNARSFLKSKLLILGGGPRECQIGSRKAEGRRQKAEGRRQK